MLDDKTKKIKPPRKERTMSRKKKIVLYILLSLAIIILAAGITVGAYVFKVLSAAPVLNPTDLQPVQTSYVYDDKGELYTSFHGEEDRTLVELKDIPQDLQDAFIAIEDERFWSHPGIDLEAIARAVFKALSGGRVEGASTITQQLLKNSILTPAKTFERKLQEQWLAIQLERLYTKEEILQMYLNRVFMGHYAHGVEAASQMYFGKTVTDLTLAESALLAAINQTPNYYSPYNNLEAAITRRNLVLTKMVEQGYITSEEAGIAKQEEVLLGGSSRKDSQPYPQFTWYMKEVAKEALVEAGVCETAAEADKAIFAGGLHIYTTLNQAMQQAIEDTITEILADVGEEEADGTMGPQVAAMIIDPSTGHVKAAVGDRDVTQNGLKRYSQSYVPTGSSIKPVLDYSVAIEKYGYTAGTVIDDAPVSYTGWGVDENSVYRPLNYHRNYQGLVTLRTALVRSLNIPAVKTFMNVGIDNAISFAHELGVNSTIYPYPSSALGGSELTLEEMTRAFGVFANEGLLVTSKNANEEYQSIFITKITDNKGNILYEPKVYKHIVMSEESTYILTDVLKGVVARYTNAQAVARPAAGKTGTSQGSQYTWFVGYTPNYVGGVWIGHDSYKYPPDSGNGSSSVPISERKWLERVGGTGSSWPALVWGNMMNNALTAIEEPLIDFVKPANISEPISISSKTGLLPGPNTPAEFIYNEIFVKGTEPIATDNFFMPVQICTESHKLAGPYCSETVVTRMRFTRFEPYDTVDINGEPLDRPLDYIWEKPTEFCDVHGPNAPETDPTEGNDENPENPEEEPDSGL